MVSELAQAHVGARKRTGPYLSEGTAADRALPESVPRESLLRAISRRVEVVREFRIAQSLGGILSDIRESRNAPEPDYGPVIRKPFNEDYVERVLMTPGGMGYRRRRRVDQEKSR